MHGHSFPCSLVHLLKFFSRSLHKGSRISKEEYSPGIYSYYYYYYYSFRWGLSDSKSPQVSRNLLSIRADLNYVVVWMVLILLLISSFSILFSRLIRSVPKALFTITVTVTHMFLSKIYLSSFLISFPFPLSSSGAEKSITWQFIWPGLGYRYISQIIP